MSPEHSRILRYGSFSACTHTYPNCNDNNVNGQTPKWISLGLGDSLRAETWDLVSAQSLPILRGYNVTVA